MRKPADTAENESLLRTFRELVEQDHKTTDNKESNDMESAEQKRHMWLNEIWQELQLPGKC